MFPTTVEVQHLKRTFDQYMKEYTREGGLHPKHYQRMKAMMEPLVDGMETIQAHKRRKIADRTLSDASTLTMFRD